MEDTQIISLYFQRSEQAIQETDTKYGGYCYQIAYHILENREDSEESVSDTYLRAWNSIPPKRPNRLATFLGRLTRNISIDRWRQRTAEKRGSGQFALCLDELEGCISGEESIEDRQMIKETVAALNRFLAELPEEERKLFMRRYWYADSVQELAEAFGCSQTKVTTALFRTRKKLREKLEKEELL